MVQGADGAWYVDAASAQAGSLARAQGAIPSVGSSDNQASVFGDFGGSSLGSGLASYFDNGVSLDLGSTFSDSSGTPKVIGDANTGFAPMSGLSGLAGWVDKNVPWLGALDSAAGVNPNDAPGGGVMGAVSSAKAGLAFITDIPRVTTTLLGLILIIAGIFALSRGPAVNIVSSAVRGAVVS